VEGLHLVVGDARTIASPSLVAGMDVEPDDLALALEGLLDRGVEHLDRAGRDAGGAADVLANAIAAQQADDGVVGELPLAAVAADSSSGGGGLKLIVGRCAHRYAFMRRRVWMVCRIEG